MAPNEPQRTHIQFDGLCHMLGTLGAELDATVPDSSDTVPENVTTNPNTPLRAGTTFVDKQKSVKFGNLFAKFLQKLAIFSRRLAELYSIFEIRERCKGVYNV